MHRLAAVGGLLLDQLGHEPDRLQRRLSLYVLVGEHRAKCRAARQTNVFILVAGLLHYYRDQIRAEVEVVARLKQLREGKDGGRCDGGRRLVLLPLVIVERRPVSTELSLLPSPLEQLQVPLVGLEELALVIPSLLDVLRNSDGHFGLGRQSDPVARKYVLKYG